MLATLSESYALVAETLSELMKLTIKSNAMGYPTWLGYYKILVAIL